ncbi:hypothetical protein J2S97_004221 [Arthrobacter oryzae]|nr:hypothetical protein [Arthrobacter oryzae]
MFNQDKQFRRPDGTLYDPSSFNVASTRSSTVPVACLNDGRWPPPHLSRAQD